MAFSCGRIKNNLTFSIRIPDTSSVTARSGGCPIAPQAPTVEKHRVQIVSERGTPFAKPVTATELAREEPRLVRRYPRKVYHDLYEKREPEPATTVKESTVMITKLTTFDSPADALAHAKAVGADAPTSTVISFSQTTTLVVPEISGTPSASATVSTTETGSVTPTPTDPSHVPTGTPTATGTETQLPTTAASATATPTNPSVIPTGTPTATGTETPLSTTSATETGSVTPTATEPSVIPTGAPTATPTVTGTETTPAPTATGTPTPGVTHTPTPSGTDTPPTTATGVPSAPKPSGLAQRDDMPEMLGSPSGKVYTTGLNPNPLPGTVTSSGGPLEPSVDLSGRRLASSGATLASAMRRRDRSDHLN